MEEPRWQNSRRLFVACVGEDLFREAPPNHPAGLSAGGAFFYELASVWSVSIHLLSEKGADFTLDLPLRASYTMYEQAYEVCVISYEIPDS